MYLAYAALESLGAFCTFLVLRIHDVHRGTTPCLCPRRTICVLHQSGKLPWQHGGHMPGTDVVSLTP